ncbi:Nif3-like dinuclear metal center hexameric protein [uncultured Thomasclavelia sp.]|uniref:Nif3-like dinuclear metal center hexameric protein n=1 Tax=uncultured Thomasclavelia sp. TaxID=3025759 RepID=UPI0025E33E1D|nr:Nif3-like dinuclear metal center hexameric protein [uncultured Thomasclavelia sp.]
MKGIEIIEYLESYFPLELQMSWDKCGVQCGDVNQSVSKVMVALNADVVSLQQAIDNDCQMLVTHHPFWLEEVTNLDTRNHHGKFIELAFKHNILVYSLHTCLDRGQKGVSMNDWLINALDVTNVHCYDELEVGKMATLKSPCLTSELVAKIKELFNVPVRLAGKEKMITTIAICGGSGADDLEQLVDRVDAYITGDSKHRHAKFALDHDMVLIDVPHHVEVIMEEKVTDILNQLDIKAISANSQDYFQYY